MDPSDLVQPGINRRLHTAVQHLDGVASLLLRLVLGPVLNAAGWEKIKGDNWFAFQQDTFPAYTVHLDNGWAAIAPSSPPPQCIEGTPEQAEANLAQRYIQCTNVNARTIEASVRLAQAKSLLREHGGFKFLYGSGALVKLNNGIEFAASYFAMLIALLVIGGGRYFSFDYYLHLPWKQRGDSSNE